MAPEIFQASYHFFCAFPTFDNQCHGFGFLICSLQRPPVKRRHQERRLAAGGLGRSGVLHRWGQRVMDSRRWLKVSLGTKNAAGLEEFARFFFSRVGTYCCDWSILKCTLGLEDTTTTHCLYVTFFFLPSQFLLFSTWTPGSWSQPRPPHCSEVRRRVWEDAKRSPFLIIPSTRNRAARLHGPLLPLHPPYSCNY